MGNTITSAALKDLSVNDNDQYEQKSLLNKQKPNKLNPNEKTYVANHKKIMSAVDYDAAHYDAAHYDAAAPTGSKQFCRV